MDHLIARHFPIDPARPGWSVCLLAWFFCAAIAPAQNLPAGTSLAMPDETGNLPPGFESQILTVDWRHPLLKVSVTSGLGEDGTPPVMWNRAEAKDPESLRIQLIEPVQSGDAWRLALPLEPLGDPYGPPGTSAVAIGSLFPWRILSAGRDDLRQNLTPSPAGGMALGVRWAGNATQLDAMPSIDLDERVLISWTTAARGRTRFALVVRTSPEAAQVNELTDWLKERLEPKDRVAIHSLGGLAIAGMKDWRMSAPSDPRRVERMGGVLVLSPQRQGDPVDWLRLKGSRLEGSSMEKDFYPDLVTRGYGGADPLDPRLWIGKSAGQKKSPPWLLAEFDQPRPITQVTMAWAQLAGWSAQFNPGRVRLEAMDRLDGSWETLAVYEDVAQPVSLWHTQSPRPIRRMRLVFERASRMGLDTLARVALWQAWGPWDGMTQAAEIPENEY